MTEEKNTSGKRFVNCIIFVIIAVCILSAIGFGVLRSGEQSEDVSSDSSVPTKVIKEEPPPQDTPLPSETPELTRTPRPTPIVFKTSPPTNADDLYEDLIYSLDDSTILNVRISGRDLVIQTHLYRSDINIFYEEIGTIHGIVIRKNLNFDRMILNDITGQKIIIPKDAMMRFSDHSIDWDAFRNDWTVINP